MPKIKYYDDVKIIKKTFKKRFIRFFTFFCIVGVFLLCVVVSNYFSSALTVGGVFSNFVYGNEKIKKNKKNYYMVTLGEYDNLDEAEKVSLGSTVQGASGYIWQDEKYYVVGSIYFSEEDASKVVNNLKDSNYNASIKVITLNEINLNFVDYENKDVRKIENAVDYLGTLVDKIYKYSIDFDKSNINNLAVSSGLSDLRGEVKVMISEMQRLLVTPNETLQKIQNTLIKVDVILNEAILKTIDNSATGYTLKNVMANLVRSEYDLYLNLM